MAADDTGTAKGESIAYADTEPYIVLRPHTYHDAHTIRHTYLHTHPLAHALADSDTLGYLYSQSHSHTLYATTYLYSHAIPLYVTNDDTFSTHSDGHTWYASTRPLRDDGNTHTVDTDCNSHTMWHKPTYTDNHTYTVGNPFTNPNLYDTNANSRSLYHHGHTNNGGNTHRNNNTGKYPNGNGNGRIQCHRSRHGRAHHRASQRARHCHHLPGCQ